MNAPSLQASFFAVGCWLLAPVGLAQTAVYDFARRTGEGLIFDAKQSAPLSPVVIDGRAGMQAEASADRPARLVLRLSAVGRGSAPVALGAVLEYYDKASPAGLKQGGDRFVFHYPTVSPDGGVKPVPASVTLWLACRAKAQEAHRQARWRRHAVILNDAALADPATAVLTLEASGTCIVRSVMLRAVGPEVLAAWASHEQRLQNDFFRQARLVIARARAEELVRQLARADCYARQSGQKGWPDQLADLAQQQESLLARMREGETLADRHYYEGRLCLIEGRPNDLAALRTTISGNLDWVAKAVARLQADAQAALEAAKQVCAQVHPDFRTEPQIVVPPHPGATTIPVYFRDRIRFFTFANSPWIGPAERFYELLSLYGVEAVFRVIGYHSSGPGASSGNADEPWKASLAAAAQEYAAISRHALKTMPATLHLHHFFILGGLPGWLRTKYRGEEYLDRSYDGEQNTTGQDSGTVNIWHPGIRKYVTDYAAAVGRQAAANPDLLGLSTFNEPRFSIRHGVSLGYNRFAIEAFRQELRTHYGTIEELNRAWKGRYAGFDAIQAPLPREKEPWQITPLYYEWMRFIEKSKEEYGRMVASAFKQACPAKPVWCEGEMCLVGDIGHVHVRPMPAVDLSNYNIRRVHRKAVVDAETVAHAPEGEQENPAEVARAATERNLLGAMLWGQRGFDFWGRYFTANANGYYAAFHDRPGGAMIVATRDHSSLAVLRDKADRFGRLLANTEVVPTGVGIVKSGSAMVGVPHPLGNGSFRILVQSLYAYGYPPFAVDADDVLGGLDDLSQYKVLIVLTSPVVRPGMNERLLAWVRDGGLMIAEGPWGVVTPYGEPAGELIREAFGDLRIAFPPTDQQKQAIAQGRMHRTIAEPYRKLSRWKAIGEWHLPIGLKAPKPGVKVLMADVQGQPLLLEAPLGKGRVVMSSVIIYPLAEYIRREVSKAIVSPARAERDGVLYTILRADARGTHFLGVVNSDSAKGVDTRIVVAGRYRLVTDLGLAHGFPVPPTVRGDFTRFPIHLAPGEGTIFRLAP